LTGVVCVIMATIWKQFKQILITAACLLVIVPAIAQVKPQPVTPVKHHPSSNQLKDFFHLAAQANATFMYPKGFREIQAPNDEDFSFDYALELPGRNFEVWYQVKPEKTEWFNYTRTQFNKEGQMANPDSIYLEKGTEYVLSFTGDKKCFEKKLPPEVLARYHADAGKSYLLTLLDFAPKHYKYALLMTLQKNHVATVSMICFTNEKGPEFYKNVNRATNSITFK